MSSLTIRKIDPQTKESLRVRAAMNGHSMEAEVRKIIVESLNSDGQSPKPSTIQDGLSGADLVQRILKLVEDDGGCHIPEVTDPPVGEPVHFE